MRPYVHPLKEFLVRAQRIVKVIWRSDFIRDVSMEIQREFYIRVQLCVRLLFASHEEDEFPGFVFDEVCGRPPERVLRLFRLLRHLVANDLLLALDLHLSGVFVPLILEIVKQQKQVFIQSHRKVKV